MATKKKIFEDPKYDFWKTLLKGATYTLIGTAGDAIIQSINGGVDLKQSVIIGVSVGVVAMVKNIVKFVWGIDLDLASLKK